MGDKMEKVANWPAAPSQLNRPVVTRKRPEHLGRTLIVSNRLPFVAGVEHGSLWLRPSNGGLASALRQIHGKSDSIWIGCDNSPDVDDSSDDVLQARFRAARLANVRLSPSELDGFYARVSNAVLWPLLHGMRTYDTIDDAAWRGFQSASARFADAVAEAWRPGDVVWVHDYQLMLVPRLIRARISNARIGFFLHTPVPDVALLHALPRWPQLVDGLTGADSLAFQTRGDASRFVAASKLPQASHGAQPDGDVLLHSRGRVVRVTACPIAIDHGWWAERSANPEVLSEAARIRALAPGPLFVGVDRLDYTKGIVERLLAFERLLSFEPQLRGRARFLQLAVPSRVNVTGYDRLRSETEEVVARINRQHGTATWTPIDYMRRSIDENMLVALYRAADVMVVTPRRDGMNLVAKEFVACRTDGYGTLVLSTGAGASKELRHAVLVDPTDIGSIMAGYRRALSMSMGERSTRMRALRETIRQRDVFDWANELLSHAALPS
jgi:trehalose 6-phosphate synthase/phosphatase